MNKNILTVIILAFTVSASAQKNYLITTSSFNIISNYTVLDIPELNNKADAIFSVRTNETSRQANPHPVGVWYTGSRWSIYYQDKAPMPAGVLFLITISEKSFTIKSNSENTRGAEVLINHEALNGNAGVKFTVTQNWNPGGNGGTYNNSDIETRYDAGMAKWILKNKSGSPVPVNAAFNIVELFDGDATVLSGSNAGQITKDKDDASSGININPAGNANSGTNADPAIYQFLSTDRIQYPSTKQQPTVRNTFKEDGFTIKEMTTVNYIAENTVLNAPADVLYAGSVIQSEQYYKNNNLNPITKAVKPGTITVVGGNGPGNGSYSRKLTTNTLQGYKDALNQILTGINMANSQGKMQFFFKSCRSAEAGMVNLGINFRMNNFSADAGLNNKTSTEKSYVVGLVKQVYYSVSYRPDDNLKDLFPLPTTLNDLRNEGFISNSNRPVYISQVDYGRMFLLVAESESSSDSLRMFLEANYRGATVQAGGRLDYNSFKNRFSVNVTIFSVGSNDNSREADDITEQSFRDFLRKGGSASLSNPGAPISFRVRDFFGGLDIPTAITADYSDIAGNAGSEVYTFFVKPGENGGQKNITTDGKQLLLKKGDVISISATGRAKHGPWAAWEDKQPDGQANEATDPNDPMPCGANQPQKTQYCECNRYAIICNIPDLNTTRKIWTCVGSGFPNRSVEQDMTQPLNFTFNDHNNNDGYGDGYTITVTRIPYSQIIKQRVAEKASQ